MKKIDPGTLPVQRGSGYPTPYDVPCSGRERRRLGDAAGLDQFGVNLLRMPLLPAEVQLPPRTSPASV